MAKSQMGFLANIGTRPKERKRPVCAINLLKPDKMLLGFDSGSGLSFPDALFHALILGTTGSGKTASLLLPAIHRIIKAGHGLIMGDIKGSLGPSVRKLAASCGRENDIVEYGSGSLAERKNMIAYMSDDGRAWLS